jgi:hypothetical protein
VALQLFIYTAWLTSGDVRRTPDGPDAVPHWMQVVAHTWEIGGLFVVSGFVYFVLVRPWRRDRRFPLDGYFMLGFLSIYWQDMLMNYTQHWVTQNTTFWLQRGSWNAEIPGWLSPHGNLIPEPIALVAPQYLYFLFGGIMVSCWVMRKAKERRPQLGVAGLLLVAYLFFVAFDLLMEPPLMRLGMFAYPGAIRSLSLFPGKYYQFPIYEAPMFAITLTALAAVRYFKNDRGQTLAERGTENLRAGPRRTGVVRGLALVGVLNVIYLFSYMVPVQWFALHADPWPADIVNSRSYLTDGLCGRGTTYRCSGPDTPIPRPGSDHVDPEGRLVGRP